MLLIQNRALTPLKTVLFVFMLFAAGKNCKAQFTYIGSGIEYTTTKFNGGIIDKTANSGVNIPISILVRPIRNVGIGLTFNLPASQSNPFHLDGGDTFERDSYGFNDSHYKTDEYDYILKRSAALTINAKFFLESELLNPYIDVHYTFLTYEETFIFQRSAKDAVYSDITGSLRIGGLSERNINYNKTHKLSYPGLAIGIMPHIAENIYLDTWVSLDFITFENDTFSYEVEDGWDYANDVHEYTTITGQAVGNKLNFSAGIGIGFFF